MRILYKDGEDVQRLRLFRCSLIALAVRFEKLISEAQCHMFLNIKAGNRTKSPDICLSGIHPK